MATLEELQKQQEILEGALPVSNSQLDNLMLSQSLLQNQIFELQQQQAEEGYLNSPLYIYVQLKSHPDTIRTNPYDDSTGFNYPLYDHYVNTTLDLGYCHEYAYEYRYTNGVLTHFQQFGVETTGSALLKTPNITTINIRE
jgi:hypothetical protein